MFRIIEYAHNYLVLVFMMLFSGIGQRGCECPCQLLFPCSSSRHLLSVFSGVCLSFSAIRIIVWLVYRMVLSAAGWVNQSLNALDWYFMES